MSPVELTDGLERDRGGEEEPNHKTAKKPGPLYDGLEPRGWGGAKSYDSEKDRFYINHSILSSLGQYSNQRRMPVPGLI